MPKKTPPSRMRISGYAINTGGPGNGLWFEHDQVASLTKQKPAHFVRNHDLGIEHIAGSVKFTEAKRHDIEVEEWETDPKTKERKKKPKPRYEKATLLGFEAELTDASPGYASVAASILALREQGRVPNVSVYIYGQALGYEEETDRFFLMGPYWIRHLGHVDTGAFSDDVGVGVYDVEMSRGGSARLAFGAEAMAAVDDALGIGTSPIEMECGVSVCLANVSDLAAKFIAEHDLDSPLVERLGKLLGKDEPEDVQLTRTSATEVVTVGGTATTSTLTVMTNGVDSGIRLDETQAAYTIPKLLSDVDSSESTLGETPMTSPLPKPAAPSAVTEATAAGAPAGNPPVVATSAAPQAPLDVAALLKQHEDAIMARVRKEQEEAALAERRKVLANTYGLDSAILAGMSVAQLEHVETALSAAKASANPLKRGARAGAAPQKRPFEEFANDHKEWAEWLEAKRKETLGPLAYAFAGPAVSTGVKTEADN